MHIHHWSSSFLVHFPGYLFAIVSCFGFFLSVPSEPQSRKIISIAVRARLNNVWLDRSGAGLFHRDRAAIVFNLTNKFFSIVDGSWWANRVRPFPLPHQYKYVLYNACTYIHIYMNIVTMIETPGKHSGVVVFNLTRRHVRTRRTYDGSRILAAVLVSKPRCCPVT